MQTTKTKKPSQNKAQKKKQTNVKKVQPTKSGVSQAMKDNPPRPKKKLMKEEVFLSKRMESGVSNTKIDVELDPNAYRLPFVAFYSDLMRTSIPVQLTNSQGINTPYATIANAVQYLYEELLVYIKGGKASPSTVPLIFNNLAAAMRGKTIRTASGATITYAWTVDPNFPTNYSVITIGQGTWATGQPMPDTGSPVDKVTAITPVASENDYQLLLSLMDGRQRPMYKVVDLCPENSPLRNSVSAFARCYAYNGLAPQTTASGVYKDVELEVPLFNPYLAQFSPYIGERRVPRFLTVSAGDACVPIGLPQVPGWGGHRNRGPVVYKFIDFDNIYDTLCAWASQAKEAIIASVDADYNSSLWTNSFSFSEQDFRIVLRQALMAFFEANYWTQFQGPIRATPNTNYFQPFMVSSGSFGSPAFTKFALPQLILENLAALKTRVIDASPKNKYVTVPVLGIYVFDTPTVWQYRIKTSGGENPVNLFAPLATDAIRLIDGWDGNDYVNLNGQYYQNILNDWNAFVNAAENVSTQVTTLAGDHGPLGLPALSMTRVCGVPPDNPTIDLSVLNVDTRIKRSSKAIVPKLQQAKPVIKPPVIAQYVVNYKTSVKRADKVDAIPAASSAALATEAITSLGPFSQEAYGLLQGLILPSIRLDPQGDQALTLPKYQTEMQEFVSAQILAQDTSTQFATVGLVNVWYNLAGLCIKGRGGEKSQYAAIMQLLAEKGHAGMLSSILGGLAKSILPPEAGGVVDAIAAVVPI